MIASIMAATPGTIRFDKSKPGILGMTFEGRITETLLRRHMNEAFLAFKENKVEVMIAEVRGDAGVDPSAVGAGRDWMRELKAAGGRELRLVTQSSVVKMTGMAAGFAVGLPVKVYATRAEAERG
jgi:hypothetical protein